MAASTISRTSSITFRANSRDREAIECAAAEAGLTTSEWLRARMTACAREELESRRCTLLSDRDFDALMEHTQEPSEEALAKTVDFVREHAWW